MAGRMYRALPTPHATVPLGNSVAIPCVEYIMRRITKGLWSLFSGMAETGQFMVVDYTHRLEKRVNDGGPYKAHTSPLQIL